jgi:Cu-Zn family superoxide dismutase
MRMKTLPVLTLLSAAVIVAGCASYGTGPSAEAVMQPTQGNTANGSVIFSQSGDKVKVSARITGLSAGLHGFHIHEKGDCSAPDGMSTGGHFNPDGKKHGAPGHNEHHAGDFGNLSPDSNGTAVLTLTTSQISLDPNASNSIIGKGLIVHADPDDFTTQPTGNSGKRLSCGVIRLR